MPAGILRPHPPNPGAPHDHRSRDSRQSHSVLRRCRGNVRAAGSGHPTTAMSISHITAVLTHHAMRWVPSEPWHPGSDRLVLSEGHAVPAVYAALADLGAVVGKEGSEFSLTRDHLLTLRDTDSVLDGHPNPAEGMPSLMPPPAHWVKVFRSQRGSRWQP